MIEKTKIYKDKIAQMAKQLDDQKEINKNKDNTVENLLARMDELSAALAAKNSEISSLRTEVSKLNEELEGFRVNKPKPATSSKHSKNFSANVKEKCIIVRIL
jgi:predicted nuclease with TOPRIM domain